MVKNSPAHAGDIRDAGYIPESGRSPGVGNGNPLQYSCMENPMDSGACRATVYGVAELNTTEHTCACAYSYTHMHTHTPLSNFTVIGHIC